MSCTLPETQHAIQLSGRDQLALTAAKPVHAPGPHQVLCRVEAAGLCFSDLKLVKAYSNHTRKSEIVSGIASRVLREIPSYVPGDAPTVPGHEAVVRMCGVGRAVSRVSPGERYLVQTDYRWLRTAQSNAAFGYNFEGALQQYVLMDERVIVSPEGVCMLLPAPDDLAASAVALVEPWACVEQAYANRERRSLKAAGRMLVAGDASPPASRLAALLSGEEKPAEIHWLGAAEPPAGIGPSVRRVGRVDELPDAGYDDVLYFGARAETVERLMPKVAPQGLLNVVLCGGRFSRRVAVPAGRAHYAGVRVAGTSGTDPRQSLARIPESAEVGPGDRVDIVGAGGPMGAMHVLRILSLGLRGVHLFAGDLSDDRLRELKAKAASLGRRTGIVFRTYNPARGRPAGSFDYIVIMVPSPALVAEAIERANDGGRINVFAGMGIEEMVPVDLNLYIEKGLYLMGTSGSRVEDMRTVLGRVSTGALDTNLSVCAVSGLDGVVEGLRAIADRSAAGKIIVYPSCVGLGLTRLSDLPEVLPTVAGCLERGVWNGRAEAALLRACAA